MPAIHVFERRSRYGGDDLLLAMVIAILFRIAQFIFCILPLYLHLSESTNGNFLGFLSSSTNTNKPSNSTLSDTEAEKRDHESLYLFFLTVYSLAGLLYIIASGFLEMMIFYYSTRGNPTVHTEPRTTRVRHMLELKLIPFLMALVFIVLLGIVVAVFSHRRGSRKGIFLSNNNSTRENGLIVFAGSQEMALTATYAFLISQAAEVAIYFRSLRNLTRMPRQPQLHDPQRSSEGIGGDAEDGDIVVEDASFARRSKHDLTEKMWEKRCSWCCTCISISTCFIFGGTEVVAGRTGARSGSPETGRQSSFGDVARALSDLLDTTMLEIVTSDMIAAFWIMRRLHRIRIKALQKEVERQGEIEISELDSSNPDLKTRPKARNEQSEAFYRRNPDGTDYLISRRVLSPDNPTDMLALEEGARYIKFALAMYSWMMLIYANPISGPFRLTAKAVSLGIKSTLDKIRERANRDRRGDSGGESNNTQQDIDTGDCCCLFNFGKTGRVRGDNLCIAHRSAFLLFVGLPDADLVYLQVKSGFEDTPYSIVLEHEWNTVVLSIRGTFSLEDSITDVCIEPIPLKSVGEMCGFDGENHFCHRGVLQAAKNVHKDLHVHRLLHNLLNGNDARYHGYRLRVTGHSLGAGVAVMLSYMLRPQFPTLHCSSFAPPGATLSWDFAVGCKEWCSTYLLGMDIVPRLSLEAVEFLRDELLEIIGRIRVPKYLVSQRLIEPSISCCSCFRPQNQSEDMDPGTLGGILYEPCKIPPNDYQRRLSEFKILQQRQRNVRGQFRAVRLYPPGDMIHIVRTKTSSRVLSRDFFFGAQKEGKELDYTPVWINNDDLAEILVSTRMTADHLPDRMDNVLSAVAKEYHKIGMETLPSDHL